MYNEEDNHSFCHHEVLINAYPLAIEWLDYDPDEPDVKGMYILLSRLRNLRLEMPSFIEVTII